MAVSRASGIVQMPARASNMQSILFSTQNTYVTSPAGRPCAGLIGFRAKKGICKTTGVIKGAITALIGALMGRYYCMGRNLRSHNPITSQTKKTSST